MANDEVSERGDAARNRKLLLDAAALLVAERGVDCVTMELLANRAGVGKGTVFRRFGSRAGLMHALLDHSETELQEAFMFGPPPLGPGAEPVERLVAFGRARLALIEVQGEILRAAENSTEMKFEVAAHIVSVSHVVMLLRQAGTHGDYRLIADALLVHQVHDLRIPLERIADSWELLARRIAVPTR